MTRGGVKGLGWGGRVGLRNFLGNCKENSWKLRGSGWIQELKWILEYRILYSNTVYLNATQSSQTVHEHSRLRLLY